MNPDHREICRDSVCHVNIQHSLLMSVWAIVLHESFAWTSWRNVLSMQLHSQLNSASGCFHVMLILNNNDGVKYWRYLMWNIFSEQSQTKCVSQVIMPHLTTLIGSGAKQALMYKMLLWYLISAPQERNPSITYKYSAFHYLKKCHYRHTAEWDIIGHKSSCC